MKSTQFISCSLIGIAICILSCSNALSDTTDQECRATDKEWYLVTEALQTEIDKINLLIPPIKELQAHATKLEKLLTSNKTDTAQKKNDSAENT